MKWETYLFYDAGRLISAYRIYNDGSKETLTESELDMLRDTLSIDKIDVHSKKYESIVELIQRC